MELQGYVVHIMVPFLGDFNVGVVWMTIIFAFAVVATSNAVNISDGLDGLSGGLAMLSYASYGVIALLQGNILLFGFCLKVVGWLLSYICFNVPHARFMMGDTGSISLSKKFFHRKIFISAPLHHHLEALGWGEAKIVMRFWIVAGVCAILGIFIAATGGAI